MPSIAFTIKNKKNKGLIFNDREFLTLYFYGVDIVNQQGTGISATTLETYIKRAQQEIEKFLSIKIKKQVITEQSDYYRDEFQRRGFVKTIYAVTYPFELNGFLGDFKQLSYPQQWLTSNNVNSSGTSRQILVVPNSNTQAVAINDALFAGTTLPHLGLVSTGQIGNYWRKKYITGFELDELPYDILEVIGKTASLNVLNQIGDTILGAGIASQSISIDALSQSVSSTASATSAGYGARIINYNKEIKEALDRLKGVYKGITLTGI